MSRSIHGTVNLPGSKSESNRALMIGAYGGFSMEVENLSDAHDTVLLKKLLEKLLLQSSTRNDVSDDGIVVDCEDAGTVARFLLTYLATQPGTWLLTGTDRLCQRPMAPLVETLRQLGAIVIGETLPLRIVGQPLKGGRAALDVAQSSQFASSLLMAAPTWENGLRLTLSGDPVSRPYLEMTMKMMEYFGVRVVRQGHEIIVEHQTYRPRHFTVSADWSAASFWYEMMAVSDGGELLLKGLSKHSLQGDAIIAEWFKSFGVSTTFESQGARLTKKGNPSQSLVFDFTHHPDLFPAVCATCFALGVDADFKGTSTLADKESNRLEAMRAELNMLGKGVTLQVYHDHRVAMSLAALWPVFGPIKIDDPSVVEKSYPGFWDDLGLISFL